jgi:hypothetical protein
MNSRLKSLLPLSVLVLAGAAPIDPVVPPAGDAVAVVPAQTEPTFRTESVRGKVVWLSDALQSQFQISTVPEAAERTLAVLTDQGVVLPLVEDLRGRSFRADERLRGKSLELLVRRYDQHPLLQVIRIHELRNGQKYELDYWCDVCAIVMFEKGLCACCQDENRLRSRLVDDGHQTEVTERENRSPEAGVRNSASKVRE